MKILFFSHYFFPEGNAPATRVHAMAKLWVEMGHEVTVITCAPNVPEGRVYAGYRNCLLPQYETVDGIRVIRVWTFIAANKGTLLRIFNFLSYWWSAFWVGLFVKKPDVVIATSPQFFCGWAGLLTAKVRRIRFVLEIRDIWPESIIAVGANLPASVIRFLEWMELKMYGAAEHIVTVGEGYRQKLLEKGVPVRSISVVTNGLDKDVFTSRDYPKELAEQWGVRDKFVCSYIGTIGMACGLRTVLDAAVLLEQRGEQDIIFLLVGDGAERGNLEGEMADRGIDNVVFTGLQPKNLMPDFLALSDCCLVHLIKSDLFKTVMPSKIFEAAGMRRPIIMGVDGPAREIVRRAGAGVMVEPENAAQLADAVCQLKAHPEQCKKMGDDGYTYICQNYDRSKLAAEYFDVLSTG